jgi:hypothetical protein
MLVSTEQDISNFMQFYRVNFPNATVTLKIHILESHVVPFLRRWHFGFGYLGEQGIESIHRISITLFAHITLLSNLHRNYY